MEAVDKKQGSQGVSLLDSEQDKADSTVRRVSPYWARHAAADTGLAGENGARGEGRGSHPSFFREEKKQKN